MCLTRWKFIQHLNSIVLLFSFFKQPAVPFRINPQRQNPSGNYKTCEWFQQQYCGCDCETRRLNGSVLREFGTRIKDSLKPDGSSHTFICSLPKTRPQVAAKKDRKQMDQHASVHTHVQQIHHKQTVWKQTACFQV